MTDTTVTRADLAMVFGNNTKVIRAIEDLFAQTAYNTGALASNADSTTELQDATVITLSPNATLTNERILALADGLTVTDNGPGSTLVLALAYLIVLNGGYACTFNLGADTNLNLPISGTVPSSAIGPYADDTAAATAGVALGEWYAKTGGALVWRQV